MFKFRNNNKTKHLLQIQVSWVCIQGVVWAHVLQFQFARMCQLSSIFLFRPICSTTSMLQGLLVHQQSPKLVDLINCAWKIYLLTYCDDLNWIIVTLWLDHLRISLKLLWQSVLCRIDWPCTCQPPSKNGHWMGKTESPHTAI